MNNFNYDLHITSINEYEPDITLDEWLTEYDIELVFKLLDLNIGYICGLHNIDLDDDEKLRDYLQDHHWKQLQDVYINLILDS